MDFYIAASHSTAMTAFLFDTLRLSRTLRDKGHFTAEQAEALAEALGEATQGDLATKADLAEIRTEIAKLKNELKTEIADLRTERKAEVAEIRTEIADLRTELKSEIAGLRSEQRTESAAVRAEIADTKTNLLKWVIGAIGFQTVLILGAVISMIKIFAK